MDKSILKKLKMLGIVEKVMRTKTGEQNLSPIERAKYIESNRIRASILRAGAIALVIGGLATEGAEHLLSNENTQYETQFATKAVDIAKVTDTYLAEVEKLAAELDDLDEMNEAAKYHEKVKEYNKARYTYGEQLTSYYENVTRENFDIEDYLHYKAQLNKLTTIRPDIHFSISAIQVNTSSETTLPLSLSYGTAPRLLVEDYVSQFNHYGENIQTAITATDKEGAKKNLDKEAVLIAELYSYLDQGMVDIAATYEYLTAQHLQNIRTVNSQLDIAYSYVPMHERQAAVIDEKEELPKSVSTVSDNMEGERLKLTKSGNEQPTERTKEERNELSIPK